MVDNSNCGLLPMTLTSLTMCLMIFQLFRTGTEKLLCLSGTCKCNYWCFTFKIFHCWHAWKQCVKQTGCFSWKWPGGNQDKKLLVKFSNLLGFPEYTKLLQSLCIMKKTHPVTFNLIKLICDKKIKVGFGRGNSNLSISQIQCFVFYKAKTCVSF